VKRTLNGLSGDGFFDLHGAPRHVDVEAYDRDYEPLGLKKVNDREQPTSQHCYSRNQAPHKAMVRIKHRYLLLNILFPASSNSISNPRSSSVQPVSLTFHSPTPLHFQAASLISLIRESVAELFGDYGVGIIAGLKIIYFSPATSTAIVRCPRAAYRLVWAALTFVGSLPGARRGGGGSAERTGCVIRVVRVSGTIRKAEEEAVRRARSEIIRIKMLEDEGGGGSGSTGLDKLLRLGQDADSALDRDDEVAGIEDMDDDSG
jgi:ribonuclease P/MRP protein subunit POP5